MNGGSNCLVVDCRGTKGEETEQIGWHLIVLQA